MSTDLTRLTYVPQTRLTANARLMPLPAVETPREPEPRMSHVDTERLITALFILLRISPALFVMAAVAVLVVSNR